MAEEIRIAEPYRSPPVKAFLRWLTALTDWKRRGL